MTTYKEALRFLDQTRLLSINSPVGDIPSMKDRPTTLQASAPSLAQQLAPPIASVAPAQRPEQTRQFS